MGHTKNELETSKSRQVWNIMKISLTREKQKISRGPTFVDFVTILTEGSMRDNTGTRVQTPLSPSIKCNVLREILWGQSKYLLRNTIGMYLWAYL